MKISTRLSQLTLLILTILQSGHSAPISPQSELIPVIVQAQSLEQALEAVLELDGEVTHELGLIDAVAARFPSQNLAVLESRQSIRRVYEDRTLMAAGFFSFNQWSPPTPSTSYPERVEAWQLHGQGLTGRGVTLAVVDTGLFVKDEVVLDSENRYRILAHYDAIEDRDRSIYLPSDGNGHGAHVSGVSLNSRRGTDSDQLNGIAPDADLVVVRAFDAQGQGTYADVIRALDWVVGARSTYGIQVLNLSFSASPRSYYWDDPLNQAVMRAWEAGIVVVTSAGNQGPDPMTVGVPGNIPYVITVGAMTDNFTSSNPNDDRLASFSAAGPTLEGFVKPEIVAPGGHILSVMSPFSNLGRTDPDGSFFDVYREVSGTSQATAVVSGLVALLLQEHPQWTPDEVKCRLLTSAKPARNADGDLAYSVFQQGAGLVDGLEALQSNEAGCANLGLDIHKDLAGIEHYQGPARWDEDDGVFYLEGEGYFWDGTFLATNGNPWVDPPWQSPPFVTGNPWVDPPSVTGNPWVDPPSLNSSWSGDLSETMNINTWVAPE